jgi:hypothetical protein
MESPAFAAGAFPPNRLEDCPPNNPPPPVAGCCCEVVLAPPNREFYVCWVVLWPNKPPVLCWVAAVDCPKRVFG